MIDYFLFVSLIVDDFRIFPIAFLFERKASSDVTDRYPRPDSSFDCVVGKAHFQII